MSYMKPVEECPTYTEYFKEGDAIPSRLCALHKGSVKQQIKRAVQGILRWDREEVEGDLPVIASTPQLHNFTTSQLPISS